MITREQILPAVRGALEELPFVEAAWLGGSESFGRNDRYSDLDFGATGDESRWEECFAHVERALERVSPIIHKLVIPMPTWHGHPQRFYQLADTDEFMRVDFIYLLPRLKHIFLEPIRHGKPVVLFDRTNALQLVELDWKAHNGAMRARLGVLRETFALFYVQPKKSALRGDEIEAVNWYFNFVVRPLIEILRMKHCPARYDYGSRYTQIDLPVEVVERLRQLHRINGCADVLAKVETARAWFEEVAAEVAAASSY
jgi:hypothetical protein